MNKYEFAYLTQVNGLGRGGWSSWWEIETKFLKSDDVRGISERASLLDVLNTLGEQGWDLACKQSDTCYILKKKS